MTSSSDTGATSSVSLLFAQHSLLVAVEEEVIGSPHRYEMSQVHGSRISREMNTVFSDQSSTLSYIPPQGVVSPPNGLRSDSRKPGPVLSRRQPAALQRRTLG